MVVFLAKPGVRTRRLAAGEDARAWEASIAAFDPARAEVLKTDRDARVFRAVLRGREVVVKVWELRSPWARLKAALGFSRGFRHWHGASWLVRHKVRTARTLALAHQHGPAVREWLVMESLPGRSVLEFLAADDLSIRRQHVLARTLGAQVALIARRGRFNRDHKPSNLIVTSLSDTACEVAVIDCVAIRRGRGVKARSRMLASLLIEPMGVACPPRGALIARCAIAESRAWLRSILRIHPDAPLTFRLRRAARMMAKRTMTRAAAIIRAHGDPRPRVDPLGRGVR